MTFESDNIEEVGSEFFSNDIFFSFFYFQTFIFYSKEIYIYIYIF
jgi:hypothetical protein